MAIRHAILILIMIAVAVYAWRDWFASLCALIVMTAVAENGNMPRTIMDIQGLNPWNVMFVLIAIPYLMWRSQNRPKWDMPRGAMCVVAGYMAIIIIAVMRAVADRETFPILAYRDPMWLVSDYMINPIKFMLPAIMLYDGCRTRQRMLLAIAAIFVSGLILAFLVLKVMPLRILTSTDDILQFRGRINRQTGLHANSLALYLCGLSWGMFAAARGRLLGKLRRPTLAAAAAVMITFLLTYSRSGYVAFVVTGLIFGALYWRPLLLLFPLGSVATVILFPSVWTRISMGIVDDDTGIAVETSGRIEYLWPPVIEEISHAPLLGIGRVGILRSPAYDKIVDAAGGCPIHPHSTFLEVLLDTGVVGLTLVVVMIVGIFSMSVRLARCRDDPLMSAIGATGLAMAVTAIIAGAGGRFFLIPSHYLMMIWCVWALVLRCSVARRQVYRWTTIAPRRAVGVQRVSTVRSAVALTVRMDTD